MTLPPKNPKPSNLFKSNLEDFSHLYMVWTALKLNGLMSYVGAKWRSRDLVVTRQSQPCFSVDLNF